MVLRLFLKSLLCAAAAAGLMGCSPDSGELLLFRDYPASFTARFSSPEDSGEVVCIGDYREGDVSLTISEPERSAGIRITCSADGCTLEAGETVIPVSEEASAALRDFVLVLTDETEGDVPVKSSDGGCTVLRFTDGVLTLDENLLPCSVVYTGMDGAERCVTIENYTIIKENPAG